MNVLSVIAANLKAQIAVLPMVYESAFATERKRLMAKVSSTTGSSHNPNMWLKHAAFAVLTLGMVIFGASDLAFAAPATTTTTLAVSPGTGTLNAGTRVTLTATVLAGTTPVTPGTVNFCDGTYCTDIHKVGTAQLTAAGKAVLSFVPTPGGHNFTASFAGTTAYVKSVSAPSTVTVGPTGPGVKTATTTTLSPSGAVGNYTLTATVVGTSVNDLTGSVSFQDATNANYVLATGTLSAPIAAPGFTTSGSFSPAATLVGDFNGDGKLDVVTLSTVTTVSDTVLVELGNGDGTFTPAAGITLPKTVYAMAAGDLNGDGKNDLAIIAGDGAVTNLYILLGNGDGTFTLATGTPLGLSLDAAYIATGDFNSDGNLDLAVVNYPASGNGSVTILTGNGTGAFSLGGSFDTGQGPNAIAVGDLNNDGNLDIVVPNSNDSANTYTVLIGAGDGTFTATNYSIGGVIQPQTVALGDFNGDGNLDLVLADYAGSTYVLPGLGTGAFDSPSATLSTVSFPAQLAVGDFNGDGLLDLAIQSSDPTQPSPAVTGIIEFSDGAGNFIDGPLQAQPSGYFLAAGDFNSDGLTDLVVVDINSESDLLLMGVSQTATATVSGISVPGATTSTHNVDAVYSGDAYDFSSTSPTVPLTAVQPTTTLGLGVSAATGTYGQPLTLTATLIPYVLGSYSTNGDTVTFFNGATSLGSGTISGGVAKLVVSTLPVGGPYSLTASYAGDANFASSASTAVSYSVTQAAQAISFTSLPATGVFGSAGPYTLTATGGASGNPVTFSITSGAAFATLSGSTLTITGAGSVTVAADQAGNSNYAAATQVRQTIVISPAAQTITFTGLPATATWGAAGPYTLTATGGGSGNPVTFSLVSGPATLSGATLTITGAGTVEVAANQAGNANYNAATQATQTILINPASQTITFTPPTSPVTFGVSPITLSATSTSGLPVTFSVVSGPGTVLGSTLTVNGAGTIVVATNQAGNTNYSAATAVQQSIVVSQASQTITFTPPVSPVTFGVSPITLSATSTSGLAVTFSVVSGPGTVLGSTLTVTGAGTIVLAANQVGNTNYLAASAVQQSIVVSQASQTIGFTAASPVTYGVSPIALTATSTSGLQVTFSLVSGPATLSGNVLTITGAGSVVLAANQAGNTNYLAATAVQQTIVVNQASQTISFTAASPVTYGVSPITLAATSTSGLPVTFSLVSGPATLSGNVLTITGAGNVVLAANQAGNANYLAATAVQQTIVVNPAAQTITFTGLPATATYGAAGPYTLTATGGASGNPVTFSIISGGSFATLSGSTLTITGAGAITVAANQAASADYAAATQATQSITISPASQTITFTGLPATATFGAAGPYTLTATGGASGNAVTFSLVSGPGTVVGSTLTITGAGTVEVAANQAASANYAAATQATQTIIISQASQTIAFTGLPATATYGAAGPYTLSATGGASGNPVTLSIIAGGSFATLSGSQLTITGAGTITVAANQAASANYAAATQATQTIVVSPASQTITFTGLPATGTFGAAGPYTLSATGGASGNAVTFSLVSGPGSVAGNLLTITGAGTVVVAADQAASANYAAATQVTQSIVIGPASQSIVFTGLPATGVYGAAGPYTLGATGGGSGNPVTFSLVSGPGMVSGNTLSITGAGTVVVAANQAANTNYTAAPQVTQTIVISQAMPGIQVSSNANPSLLKNPVILTATVTATVGAPSGTVTFLDGTTPLGTGTLSAGIATLTTSTLTAGTHSITASYGGDTNFMGAASGALSQLVEDFSLAISATGTTTVTASPGSNAVFNFTLSPTGATTFPAAITLSATGGPAGATYTFVPASIAAGAGSTPVTLTVEIPATAAGNALPAWRQTAAPMTVARNQPASQSASRLPFLALALLLLPFAGRMRRAGRKMSRMLPLFLLLVAGIAAAVSMSGCGGSSGGSKSQTYTITITGTSGALTHTTDVTLIVK